MKIAVLGSAPSSLYKAPFGDPAWSIWACSPGAYPALGRVDEFWEVHRWEPGVIGKPQTQRPWFTPEYVQWLKTVPPVLWVADPDAEKDCPNAKMLPWQELEKKYGSYVWTSSVSYMTAMAIERICADRDRQRETMRAGGAVDADAIEDAIQARGDCIGFWGVDMAATDELYTSQRFSAQWFIQLIVAVGIDFYVPPESDLCTPPPKYGVSECTHRHIKWLARMAEIESHIVSATQRAEHAREELRFFEGAKDDLRYMQAMWMNPGEDTEAIDLPTVLGVRRIGSTLAVKPVSADQVMNPEAALAQKGIGAPVAQPKDAKRVRKGKRS